MLTPVRALALLATAQAAAALASSNSTTSAASTSKATASPPSQTPPSPIKALAYAKTAHGFTAAARGWDASGLDLDQAEFETQCATLAESELAAANSTYCSLGHGWWASPRAGNGDQHGRLGYERQRFDVPWLARRLHERGLLLGITVVPGALHQDRGKVIKGTRARIGDVCAGEGSKGHCVFDYGREETQAWHDSVVEELAKWGVDYIRLDTAVQMRPTDEAGAVQAWSRAVAQSGSRMRLDVAGGADATLALCNAHADAMQIATTQQRDEVGMPRQPSTWGAVRQAIEAYRRWITSAAGAPDAGLRVRPDLGTLPGGSRTTELSEAQRRTAVTHWLGAGANLFVGSPEELRRRGSAAARLLANREALAVADFTARFPMQPRKRTESSRSHGRAGGAATTTDEDDVEKTMQVWIAGPSEEGEAIVVLANYGPPPDVPAREENEGSEEEEEEEDEEQQPPRREVEWRWWRWSSAAANKTVKKDGPKGGPRQVAVSWSDLGVEGRFAVRDIWNGRDVGIVGGGLEMVVEEGDSVLLRLTSA